MVLNSKAIKRRREAELDRRGHVLVSNYFLCECFKNSWKLRWDNYLFTMGKEKTVRETIIQKEWNRNDT